MHELRKIIAEGRYDGSDRLIAKKKAMQKDRPAGLSGMTIHRKERRQNHQRHEDRYPLEEEYAQATWRDESAAVRIVNISSNGLQLECDWDAQIADMMHVSLGDCDPVECVVRWRKDDRFGIEFSCETQLLTEAGVVEFVISNIANVLSEAGEKVDRRVGVERRSSSTRHNLAWLGKLHKDSSQSAVLLRNISGTGALLHLECDLDLHKEDECMLDLGQAGQVAAIVQWSSGREVGVKFRSTYDLSLLVHQGAVDASAISLASDPDLTEPNSRNLHESQGLMTDPANSDPDRPLTLKELHALLYQDGRFGKS